MTSLGKEIAQGADEMVFQTANGVTSTSDTMKYHTDDINETVEPFVLDETPTGLSIERRCVKMGCSFHWMSGKLPFMITPEYEIVHLHVMDHSLSCGQEKAESQQTSSFQSMCYGPHGTHTKHHSKTRTGR